MYYWTSRTLEEYTLKQQQQQQKSQNINLSGAGCEFQHLGTEETGILSC